MNLETEICLLASILPKKYRDGLEDTFEDSDIVEDVSVEIEYDPGTDVPACFSGSPDNWHPDESEDPQITSVKIDGIYEIEGSISDKDRDDLLMLCWEDQADDHGDYDDDYDDDDYDDPAHDYIN